MSSSRHDLMPRDIEIFDSYDKRKYLNTAVSYDDMNYYHDSGHSTLKFANEDLDTRLSHYGFINSKAPLPVRETALNTVKLNGTDITGIWVNKDECVNWKGPIPLDHYKINNEPPTVIKKHATQSFDQLQNVSIRYLKPPSLPPPGDLIIRQEPDIQLPPAPPIIIRQQAAALRSQSTVVYREKPPKPPAPVPTQTITIPGRQVDPPPRQVIIERIGGSYQAPQDIIVERWLSYPKQKRNIIHQKSANTLSAPPPKNIIIDWETVQTHTTDVKNQKLNFLGVETADPNEFIRRYGNELIDSNKLPSFVSELTTKLPNGEVLASNVSQSEFLLSGDVEALKLVDRNKINLNDYLVHKF